MLMDNSIKSAIIKSAQTLPTQYIVKSSNPRYNRLVEKILRTVNKRRVIIVKGHYSEGSLYSIVLYILL